jgi:hypothetical protein
MNNVEVAKYIKQRLRKQKITDESPSYLEKWTKGWNSGISHSMKMIDEILHDYNSKNEQMNSETDKLNELKNEMMTRATDARNTIGNIPCDDGVFCLDECIYHSSNPDEWGNYCQALKVKNLLNNIIKLSKIDSPQYMIVSKSERVFGPASKEDCEARAQGFVNVEIKEV